jgi:hypothetical protein
MTRGQFIRAIIVAVIICAGGKATYADTLFLSSFSCNLATVSDGTSATLTCNFTTNIPTTSVLNYGLDNNYGAQVLDNTLATTHVMSATGLQPYVTYFWDVQSTSADGQMVDPEGEAK